MHILAGKHTLFSNYLNLLHENATNVNFATILLEETENEVGATKSEHLNAY